MRTSARDLALPAAVAAAAAAVLAWLGLLTAAFTDYQLEAEPSLRALRAGDLGRFLEHAPAYGGSLLERAPFALLPSLWGGGADAVFRTMAVPGLAAGVALALVLFAAARRAGASDGAAYGALLLVAANPFALRALEIGHAEELLVGGMAAGAVLAAARGRAVPAGVLLGLAAAGKPWAALAALPVLAALPERRAILPALAAAAACGGAVALPFLLAGGAAAHGVGAAATTSGQIFKPWQLFWLFGDGHVVTGLDAVNGHGSAAPAWISRISHPAVLGAGLILGAAGAVALRRPGRAPHDALLLLAAVLLVRELFDTWNTDYYALPFVLALVSWEAVDGRAPLLTAASVLLGWLSFTVLGPHGASADAVAGSYLAWTVPLALALSCRALTGRWTPIRTARPSAPPAPAAPATALLP